MAATDLSNAPVSVKTPTMRMPLAPGGGVGTLDSTIAARAGVGATLQFPQDLGKYYMTIDILEYKRSDLMTMSTGGNSKAKIFLPIPLNLMETQTEQYTEEPLGMFAGTVGNKIAGDLSGGGLSSVFTPGNAVLGGLALAASSAESAILNNPVTNIASALAGVAPNPFVTVLFKRPVYKTHQLQFKLSPQNFNEAINIRKIILALKQAAAPGVVPSGMVFTFPKILRIAYQPNSGYLYKFKPSVIEAISVNYAGGGAPAFYRDNPNSGFGSGDNPPESVDIALQIKELEYWVEGNFHDTNDPTDGEMQNGNPYSGNDAANALDLAARTAFDVAKMVDNAASNLGWSPAKEEIKGGQIL